MPVSSREFDLAVACCRWPPSPERESSVRAAAEGIDWERFERVARRHRVEGLIWDGLRRAEVELPQATRTRLAAAAGEIARDNLLILAESLALDRKLRAAGTSPLFLKGLTFGQLAYGQIGLKRGWDIDLIVVPDQIPAAARILAAAGYHCTHPGPGHDPEALARFHRTAKESVWRDQARNLYVELHSALADNPLLLPDMGAHSPAQSVTLAPGRALETLEADRLFAYLCVHGASSAWFRLKWSADLAAWLAGNDEAENERLYRQSQNFGAGRAAAQALLLVHHLFGTALPRSLIVELEAKPVNRWLYRSAWKLMAGRHGEVELHHRRFATLPIHLTQFGLLPGWRFKLGELRRQVGQLGG